MTASRVANGGPGVGEATRARVLDIMHQLGYRPNASARSLRTGRPTAVGIIYAPPTSPGAGGLLFSVEQAAADAGFDVNLATLAAFDTDTLLAATARLAAVPVAAIILLAPQAAAADTLRDSAYDVPIVVLWGDEALGLPAVAVDHRRAAATATQHLLGLGHPRVWHVSGPQSWILTKWRIQGWRDALRAAHSRAPALVEGDWSPRSGYLAGRRLLENRAVSAVFLANDAMAQGFLAAARELGRRIPEDVSVVGFDDDPGAEYATPPLTTVRLDFPAIGRSIFDLAVRQMTGVAGGDTVAVSPELVVRESTGPFRKPALRGTD